MTPEQEYCHLFERMFELCHEHGWGDPGSYARSREIYMAIKFDHQVATTYSGADAFDGDIPLEYKSTIAKTINATYNGISVQDSWNEQVTYLEKEKIKCYNSHYVARYEGAKIVEMYRLDGEKVYNILLPKLQKDFERKSKSTKKDPRLSASLSMTNIKQNGQKIR